MIQNITLNISDDANVKSNVFVTCTEYNSLFMLIYKHLTSNAVQEI